MPGLDLRRSGARGRAAGPFLVALLLAVALLTAACTSSSRPAGVSETTAAPAASPVKTVTPPATPAGAQLGWLAAELARLPMSDAQVRAHFDEAFLAQVSPAALN